MLQFAKKTVRKTAKALLNIYPEWLVKREFDGQSFRRFNERPVEFGFVFRKLAEIYPHTVLDVGTGTTALPHLMRNCGFLVTATDNIRDYWPAGMVNRHHYIVNDDITDTTLTDTYDLVTCVSVLEHIQKPDDAIRNMFALLNPGGHLVLTVPYTEDSYVRNVYELEGSSYGQHLPYTTQAFSRAEMDRWLSENDAVIVDQEFWQFWEGTHWTVGEQVIPPLSVGPKDKHQLTCVLIRKAG